MSEIARDNGLTLKQLLALNPQIKDANVIKEGEKINLREGENRNSRIEEFLKRTGEKISGGVKDADTILHLHRQYNTK